MLDATFRDIFTDKQDGTYRGWWIMEAYYKITDFIDACKNAPTSVFVHKGAAISANEDFNLNPWQKVVGFIGNDGLEKPVFENVAPWENNPDPEIKIMVDSYSFFSGSRYGYIAFFFSPVTKKWNIKSFKNNNKPDPRAFALRDAFMKANIMLAGKDKKEER